MAPAQGFLSCRGALCRSCLLGSARSPALPQRHQRRPISQGWIRKTQEAEEAWQKRAQEILDGKIQNTWDMLEERGYVKDTAGTRDTIRELMRRKRIAAYVGIDPTASSLHVGHLLPLMPLFWMYMHGYGAFSLIGGSTVKIGDPTDRLKSREPISKADLAMNMTKMHFQLKKLWANVEDEARRFGYKKEWAWRRGLINNNTWWNKQPMLEVLKRVGTHMRLGPMLSRETVKRKMTEGDGVSFAEFSYPIMQGWDWWMLFQQRKVQMQIGGSDQYGNIITGIEIVKAARDSEPDPAKRLPANDFLDDPVGFTVPLLTDSAGNKFGKSAGNAIWLDPFMTPPYDLYGYFVRRPDDEVERLLKLFTFLPMDEIQKIMMDQVTAPEKRIAHHHLAYEVVRLCHGKDAADEAQTRHKLMYSKGPDALKIQLPKSAQAEGQERAGIITPNNAPRIDMILPESLIMGKSIGKILYAAGLAKSASEGHRLAVQQAVYIGGAPGRKVGQAEPMDESQLTFNPVKLWFPQETQRYLIDGKILILRRGKHNVRIIKMVSDEEYAKSGETYPGQPYTGAVRMLREQIKQLKSGLKTPEEVRKFIMEESKREAEEKGKKGGDEIEFPDEKPGYVRYLEGQLNALLDEVDAGKKGEDEGKKE